MSPQHLRLCVKPGAGDVAFTRFVDAKDVPQVAESNRRTTELSTRYEEDVQTWVELGGKLKTGAVVMFQPSDHGMKCVMLPLTLELLLLVIRVGTSNSVKARGLVIHVAELGVGVIVLVATEPNNVLSKDECF